MKHQRVQLSLIFQNLVTECKESGEGIDQIREPEQENLRADREGGSCCVTGCLQREGEKIWFS